LRHHHFRHIITAGHPKSINLGERPVRICDDVWIAAGATVLRGVTVGRGAIVGAGAVVTKDVEPWSVVGGNPSQVIRYLDPEEDVESP
jgi:acetyltransferase-like isoleucine patch superfamily enzyme